METTKLIQQLKQGDWFVLTTDSTKNSYQFQGELMPKVYGAACHNDMIEISINTQVEKIDGFQLYLLQGGRDWD